MCFKYTMDKRATKVVNASICKNEKSKLKSR